MASQSVALLNARPLGSGYVQPLEEVVDLGAYRQLNVSFRVLGTNPTASVLLEHSASKDESAFRAVDGMTVSCDTAGVFFETTDAFLRYVRMSVTSFGAGNAPVVSVSIIAKE